MSATHPYRTLIIDDDACVHEVFASMLSQELARPPLLRSHGLAIAADHFPQANFPIFEVDTALDGEQGLNLVRKALAEKRPYTMAFVDMRMNSGWNGIDTIDHIWKECPELQIIICTAHADFSWHDIIARFGHTDRLLLLKKPFDVMDVRQLAYAMAEKWNLFNQARNNLERLQDLVTERTAKLQEANDSLQLEIAHHKQAQEDLRRQRDYIDEIIRGTPAMVAGIAPFGFTTFVNPAVCKNTGYAPDEIIGKSWWRVFFPDADDAQIGQLFDLLRSGPVEGYEMVLTAKSGEKRTVNWNFFNKSDAAGTPGELIAFGNDVTEQKHAERAQQMMEIQLRQAQKLESIGQLAAGIAHEVNTPNQYIGDNIRFLKTAFGHLETLLRRHDRLLRAVQEQIPTPALITAIENARRDCDFEFLMAETPRAIDQSLEGVASVTRIVHSMRDFSHPGTGEKIPVDINHAVESTLVVAANEWKYVANMVREYQTDLPRVPCLPGELNQVVLNLVVNAAHAIADVVGDGSRAKGTITVSTRQNGDWAEIQVRDTGTGIPKEIRDRVFDPFFTTQPVGKGSGQGLAIARSVVVGRHNGTLTFETEPGVGTVFTIRLPMRPAQTAQEERSAA